MPTVALNSPPPFPLHPSTFVLALISENTVGFIFPPAGGNNQYAYPLLSFALISVPASSVHLTLSLYAESIFKSPLFINSRFTFFIHPFHSICFVLCCLLLSRPSNFLPSQSQATDFYRLSKILFPRSHICTLKNTHRLPFQYHTYAYS